MNTKLLRSKLLSLAIRGRLVPQDPNDEPAAELLKRINPKAAPLSPDDAPFPIPDSWCWTTLGEIGKWQSGSTPSRTRSDYYGGNIPWLKTGDLNDGLIKTIPENITQKALEETSVKLNPAGSVLIAMYGATVGKIGILTFPATTNQACCACSQYKVEQMYLFYFLLANRTNFIAKGVGGAQPNISKEKIVATPFPLPPLAEQERIVKEVERWFACIEQMERSREALGKATRQTKRTLLSLAIAGRLVPQDPNDEPAITLLRRINPKAAPLSPDDAPFTIPDNWCWCKVEEIGNIVTGSTPPKGIKEYYNGDIPFFKPADLEPGVNVCKSEDHVSELGYKQSRQLPPNSILVSCIGSIGKTGIISVKGICNQQINAIIPHKGILPMFVYFICNTSYMKSEMLDKASATTIAILNKGNFSKILFPLPPLAEQERIVKEVEELFAVLDRLSPSTH